MKKIIFFFALIVYTPISLSSDFVPKISNNKKIMCIDNTQQSTHDQRLELAVISEYSDTIASLKPSGSQITASLKENTESVSIPLSTYHNLFNQTNNAFNHLKTFPLHAQKVNNLCNYFQEQYTLNTKMATTSHYTTILTLGSPTIMLPLELCKKIAAYIEPIAFKVVLVMLRAASNGIPKTLDPHLYKLYQKVYPS